MTTQRSVVVGSLGSVPCLFLPTRPLTEDVSRRTGPMGGAFGLRVSSVLPNSEAMSEQGCGTSTGSRAGAMLLSAFHFISRAK
jgi:hypothetical protein